MTASSDADAIVHTVETHLATGDYRQAEDVLRPALALNPHHPRLLTAHARTKLGQSDYASAANSAHAALSVAPDNEYVMRVYSRALELQGRIPDALWMAWRTATTHPQSHLAHHNYGRLLVDAGRPAEAMTAINEALRLNPEDASAVHNLAMLENARGRRWSAIRGFLSAGRLDPSFGEAARQNVAVVLTGMLRRSTWLVLIVAIAVITTYNLRDDGGATVIPRIVAGVGAVLLLVFFARLMREIPGRTLTSVLRQRQILAIRILQMLAGVVFGSADRDPRCDDDAGGVGVGAAALATSCRHRRWYHQ